MKQITLTLLLLIVGNYGLGQDRTIPTLTETERELLTSFQKLDTTFSVQITNEKEAGTALIVCGTLIKRKSGKYMANQEIYLYHTDNSGEYRPKVKEDNRTARLNGRVTTDKKGRFIVNTILPGDYPANPDTRHIHLIIGNTLPEEHDFYFRQYAEDYLVTMVEEGEAHFLIDLKKTKDGILAGFVRMTVNVLE